MIIVEGPDGGGKTTLLERIQEITNRSIVHAGGPPDTVDEIDRRMTRIVEGQNSLFDRASLFSEQVYGPIVRGSILIDEGFIESWYDCLLDLPLVIVYVRSDISVLVNASLTAKPHKSLDHVEAVRDNIKRIASAYDELTMNLTLRGFVVLYYNRGTMDLDRSIHSILAIERSEERKHGIRR